MEISTETLKETDLGIVQAFISPLKQTVLQHGTKAFAFQLRTTKGARNPKFQVVITQAWQLRSQHSFALPLQKKGMYRTQSDSDHARLYRL